MMNNYTNRTTLVFEGIETDARGIERVVRRSLVTSADDTWPGLFEDFMRALS